MESKSLSNYSRVGFLLLQNQDALFTAHGPFHLFRMLLDPPLRLLQKGTINFASQNCFITNAALLAQYLEGAELDGNASGSLRAYAANE